MSGSRAPSLATTRVLKAPRLSSKGAFRAMRAQIFDADKVKQFSQETPRGAFGPDITDRAAHLGSRASFDDFKELARSHSRPSSDRPPVR